MVKINFFLNFGKNFFCRIVNIFTLITILQDVVFCKKKQKNDNNHLTLYKEMLCEWILFCLVFKERVVVSQLVLAKILFQIAMFHLLILSLIYFLNDRLWGFVLMFLNNCLMFSLKRMLQVNRINEFWWTFFI